jgi:hypothetical protein
MVFNTTLNNVSVISWRSVLLEEESGVQNVPWENQRPVASHWQSLSHNVVRVHIAMNRVQTHNFSGDILFLNGMIPVMQIKVISIGPSEPV